MSLGVGGRKLNWAEHNWLLRLAPSRASLEHAAGAWAGSPCDTLASFTSSWLHPVRT